TPPRRRGPRPAGRPPAAERDHRCRAARLLRRVRRHRARRRAPARRAAHRAAAAHERLDGRLRRTATRPRVGGPHPRRRARRPRGPDRMGHPPHGAAPRRAGRRDPRHRAQRAHARRRARLGRPAARPRPRRRLPRGRRPPRPRRHDDRHRRRRGAPRRAPHPDPPGRPLPTRRPHRRSHPMSSHELAVTPPLARRRWVRVLALIAAAVVPLAFAGLTMAALSDTEKGLDRIPAAIVNQDEMVTQTGDDGTETMVLAGRLLVTELTGADSPGMDWRLSNAEEAATQLAAGEVYAVLTIPSDF